MESEFIKSVVDIQMRLNAPKGQFNKFGNFRYRSCEDILEALKPLLKEHGMFLTLKDTLENIGDRYYVKATATITDGVSTISNTAYAREAEHKTGSDQAQITGAASSYARKYALGGLLLIDDGRDPDCDDNSGEGKQPAAKPTAKPKAKGSEKPQKAPVNELSPTGEAYTLEQLSEAVKWAVNGEELQNIWSYRSALTAEEQKTLKMRIVEKHKLLEGK